MSAAFTVSGLQQFQKLDDYRLPAEAPFAKKPTSDVTGSKKASQRFLIEPVQAVGSGVAKVVTGIWELIKAILRTIARALGLQNLQTEVKQNEQGKESMEVIAEGDPQALAQMHAASSHVLSSKDAFAHFEAKEPMPEIKQLNKEFAEIKEDVEAFERDWTKTYPNMPLINAFGVDHPVYRQYAARIEQSKAIIVRAQAILELYPHFENCFSAEILSAIRAAKMDLEKQVDPEVVPTFKGADVVLLGEKANNTLRDEHNAQDINVENDQNTTQNDSVVSQSAQSNVAAANPGAHLPGLLDVPLSRVEGVTAANVLPIFHRSNPRNPLEAEGRREQEVSVQRSAAQVAPKSSRFGLPAGRPAVQMPAEFDVETEAPRVAVRERQLERQS